MTSLTNNLNGKFISVVNTNIVLHFLGSKYSKSDSSFSQTNEQIERLSEIIFTVSVKVILQLMMLPKIFVSFAVYLITNAGSDAFQLPFPMW